MLNNILTGISKQLTYRGCGVTQGYNELPDDCSSKENIPNRITATIASSGVETTAKLGVNPKLCFVDPIINISLEMTTEGPIAAIMEANNPMSMVDQPRTAFPTNIKVKNSQKYGMEESEITATKFFLISSNLTANPARISTMIKARSLISELALGNG